LRMHALPHIGDMQLSEVRPRHIREIVRALVDEGKLSPRTIRHVYGTLRTMFQCAIADEKLTGANPCSLQRGDLPKKVDKGPSWRATAVFSRTEVEAIISDERIPLDRRVMYAGLALTGERWGEWAARTWRDYDRSQEPLGRL